jgi:hypothetical protein
MTDDKCTPHNVRLVAQELNSEYLKIENDAAVHQEAGGCYVAAWVWVPSVYITHEDDGTEIDV